VIPCGVGAFLAVKGFWPILPFAGLEMALLGWALKLSWSAAPPPDHYRNGRDVSIESRLRERCSRIVFPRHWAQVKLRRPKARLHPSRLTIESHGRQCELGSFLTEEDGVDWRFACSVSSAASTSRPPGRKSRALKRSWSDSFEMRRLRR